MPRKRKSPPRASAGVIPESQPGIYRGRRRRRGRQQSTNANPLHGVVPSGGSYITISGSDLVGTYSIGSNPSDGALLGMTDLCPSEWPDTFAHRISSDYARYRFASLTVSLIAKGSSLIGGGFMAGIDLDPESLLVPGVSAKRKMRSLAGAVTCRLSETATIRYNPGTSDPFLETRASGDSRNYRIGRLFAILDGVPNLPGSGSINVAIDVMVAWTLHLRDPTLGGGPVPQPRSWKLRAADLPRYDESGVTSAKAFKCDSSISTEWSNFWSQSHFDNIYAVEPDFPDSSFSTGKDGRFLRTMSGGGNWYCVVFKSLTDARKAGSNPAHDVGMEWNLTAGNKIPVPTCSLLEIA